MSTKTSSEQLMQELLLQAKSEMSHDRRSEARVPFFRAVSVRVGKRSFSAFIREISISSVGMLHNMQLRLEEVDVTVSGQRRGFRVQLERCEPCGEGWYISGGTVIDSDD